MAEEESNFPIEDWQYEVANGDTNLGYREWRANQTEMARYSILQEIEDIEESMGFAAPPMQAFHADRLQEAKAKLKALDAIEEQPKQWAMVQNNNGTWTVTLHPTEEAAYRDIVDTVAGDLSWINLDSENDPEAVENFNQVYADSTKTAEQIYEEVIEGAFFGESDMFVVEALPTKT